MKVTELKARLSTEGFGPQGYSLDGEPLPFDEGFILERAGDRWKIEFFERGERQLLEVLATEDEACERMYELLRKYSAPVVLREGMHPAQTNEPSCVAGAQTTDQETYEQIVLPGAR